MDGDWQVIEAAVREAAEGWSPAAERDMLARLDRVAGRLSRRPVSERSLIARALLGARRLGWRWHDSWDQGAGWRQIELRPPGSTKATFITTMEVWRFEAPLKGRGR